MTRRPSRLGAALVLLIVAVTLILVGCGGGDSSTAEPSPSEPVEPTTGEAPANGGEEISTEPEILSPPLLDPPFALEIGDVVLVLGGGIVCQVAEDGMSCADVDEDGPKAGRYSIKVSGAQLEVTLVAADGDGETVFLESHADPSADVPLEPAEPQETVILEEGDAVRVSGTDIVCVAGELGFIGCSRLDEEGGLRPGTLAVGLDSAGVSVASIGLDGTVSEAFSRTHDE